MKKTSILLLAISFSFSFYAFKVFEERAGEVLQRLGIPEEIAKDCIWSSFSGRYLSYPDPVKLRKVAMKDRAAAVREIAEYAKTYTRTAEFNKKYLEYRDGLKPTPPEKPKSMAEQRKEQKKQMQKAIKETEANMKSMSADQKETMKGVVTMYKEQLKSLDDPNNPMFTPEIEKMYQQGYEAQVKEHKEKLAKWETDNPSTPNEMVRKWLTEFLEVSKDVDYNARLIDGDGGKKMFAMTEFERKPSNWKMCFRAGRESVEAGQTFARQWLSDLNKAK
jgi:flagellar biosynthesis GTPase FlhF